MKFRFVLIQSFNLFIIIIFRVFALLTYLGQKSVASGRASQVIDAILQALSTQLRGNTSQSVNSSATWSGLANTSAPQLDMQLVSWLLLYLSLCLDGLSPTRSSDAEKGKDNGE